MIKWVLIILGIIVGGYGLMCLTALAMIGWQFLSGFANILGLFSDNKPPEK